MKVYDADMFNLKPVLTGNKADQHCIVNANWTMLCLWWFSYVKTFEFIS